MSNIQNVYEQIDTNKRKSWFLILGFTLFILAFGYFFTYLYNYNWGYLIFALVFSTGSSFTSYFYSDKIALTISHAQPAPKTKFSRLHSIVENISRVANIPKPKVYVIPSDAMNAFATGRDPKHATVTVTQGLLDNLNRTELEGVIAHEISHIANYDTRLMTLVAVLVGSIALIMDWSFRFGMGRGSRNDNKQKSSILMIIGILLIILAPLVANIIKLAISRRREFYADAQGVKFTRQPSGLIEALKKISQSKKPLETASPATAHMYISNPLKGRREGQWLAKLFSTHPPVKDRILALQGKKV